MFEQLIEDYIVSFGCEWENCLEIVPIVNAWNVTYVPKHNCGESVVLEISLDDLLGFMYKKVKLNDTVK